ncbi:hypothetical protein GGQ71_001481 [Rhizobium taibaishanense]|uniref:Uncharacterized protein n=1 Tax=Allorhizobium taibaishanense TaxID=887144 RepID=A0A7W6MTM4_9HYPH|nr:hypothetical protein [Allorhizobium taibaishanense]
MLNQLPTPGFFLPPQNGDGSASGIVRKRFRVWKRVKTESQTM